MNPLLLKVNTALRPEFLAGVRRRQAGGVDAVQRRVIHSPPILRYPTRLHSIRRKDSEEVPITRQISPGSK